MESWMAQASELTDSPSGINNYAEPSLHLASTYRNRSKQFTSKLSLKHPIVTKFLSKNQNESHSKQQEQQREVQKFSDFLKNSKGSEPKGQRATTEQNNKKPFSISNQVSKFEPEPSFATSPEVATIRSGFNFEGQTPKFGNQNFPEPQVPLRPTFQNSNVRPSNTFSNSNFKGNNSGPKFGLPGVGPRPPPPPPVQRLPLQRQGSFTNGSESNFYGNTAVCLE